MVNNFTHKSKISFLLKTRSKFKDTLQNEKKVLFFLKNKIESVLDIGCGTGFIYEWILKQKKKIKYLGIDIDTKAIKYAKKNYKSKFFKRTNFFNINNRFNLVLMFQLFYQFRNYKNVLNKLYKISDNYISFDARIKFNGNTILDKDLSYFYYHDTGKTNNYIVHNVYEFINYLSNPRFNFEKIYLNIYKPKKITSAFLPFKKTEMFIGVFILKKGRKLVKKARMLRNKNKQYTNLVVNPKKYEKYFK